MKIEDANVTEVIKEARQMLKDEKGVSASFAAVIAILLTLFEVILSRLNTNSQNSSKPPSQDPNRKKILKAGDGKKPGGQQGRVGKNLKLDDNPDEIIHVLVDQSKLPKGRTYKKVGVKKRQVVEIIVSRKVIEYQLEILEDEKGRRYTADSPEGVSRPAQYGSSVKAMVAYMNVYQLIPFARVEDYFRDVAGIPLSSGSIGNFIKDAYDRLETFELIAIKKLRDSAILHSDETGINIKGKSHWLHAALNAKWTLFMPHIKRGKEAMDAMGILPEFTGVLIHDHWKSYFRYIQCLHALCNAHHLRELQAVVEMHPEWTWAKLLKDLLMKINAAVHKAGGILEKIDADEHLTEFRRILQIGDAECPAPPPPAADPGQKKKRGKQKKTKARNLLERLRDYEEETLRFMNDINVPFTNNPGENDIRMTKVKMKISGCFMSFEGAEQFCRVRSYLLTCQKHGIYATEALNILFSGKLPDFCTTK